MSESDAPPDPTTADALSVRQVAHTIAQALGETQVGPKVQITRITQALGVDGALALLEETRRVESAGGLMLPNGSRRRTIGGVFFYMARQHIPTTEHERVFGRKRQRATDRPRIPQPPPPPPFRLADRDAVLSLFTPADYGEIRSMDNKFVGRPMRVEERGETAITMVRMPPPPTNLPKGVPAPQPHPALCTIYMSAKQWRKVKPTFQSTPDDKLVIEGWLVWDTTRNEYTLSARSVKSTTMERQSRTPQPTQPGAQ